MQEDVFTKLADHIISDYGGKYASGRKEVVKRCHLCGDSRKDIKMKRLYIGQHKQTGLIVYNCFNCLESGLVDSTFLREMGMYDIDLIMSVVKYNMEIMNLPTNRLYRDRESRYIRKANFPIRTDEISTIKLNYINNRLGTSFSFKDATDLKIILNLYDFLNANNIQHLTRNKYITDYLDRYFLGFLSYDNSYINMRNIANENIELPNTINKRYVNYNALGKINNANRFYILPNKVNTLYPIKLHITEGVFDILSVYYNVVKPDSMYNGLFAAGGGKSYLNLIKFILSEFGIMNIEIHIYPDADIPDYSIMDIREYLYKLGFPMYMHRNAFRGEKDFGVPSNRIIDSVQKIL